MYYLKQSVSTVHDNFIRFIIHRCASNGLGLWHLDINNKLRLQIDEYWKDKIRNNTLRNEDENNNGKEKYYILSMFPYPSGSLHMGHVRVYAISDAVARFHRMRGRNVIHPMGWDAFGLPAENAALERKVDAAEWTKKNISNMKEQLNIMGCDFDWDREITTCEPDYYRWTQELFLKLYECDLAYQNEAFVNWDPVDQTVLADEQVDHNGKSWRSGAKVEKKLLKQWFIRTKVFAKRLYEGLDDPILKEWRDVKKIQRHWIGECTGVTIEFKLVYDFPECPQTITLWTDKPELIKHAKFVAVSKDHFLVRAQDDQCHDIDTRFLNAKAVNPFNNEELPIYFTNFIKFSRLRDNYLGIPCDSEVDAKFCENIGINYDQIAILSDEVRDQMRREVMDWAQKKKIGGYSVSANLKDWLISRQRYWGTPIPIVHCKNCGVQPIPKSDLPVILPNKFMNSSGIPNLRQAVDWLKTSCPNCGGDAMREADTMDTFVDSSWYFMRFIDPKNTKEMFCKNKAAKYLPVDLYIGGKEHAALHLYYARFVNYFLHSKGLLPTKEPFKQLLVQGMVNGMSFRIKNSGKYLKPNEVEQQNNIYVEKSTGNEVIATWEKMSKSKHNGVDPMDLFIEYGVDTTRLLILADVAPTSPRNWSTSTSSGIFNWQTRMWLSIRNFLKRREQHSINPEPLDDNDDEIVKKENAYMYDSRNFYIKGVTFNIIGSQQLSVAISKMQGLTNSLRKVSVKCLTHSPQYERALATQIIMIAPLAPRLASELWAGFCSAPYYLVNDDECIQRDKDVLEQIWPTIDMDYNLKLHVHVNNNAVISLKIPRRILYSLTDSEIVQMALESEEFKNYVRNREISNYRLSKVPGCDTYIYFHVKSHTSNLKIKEAV